MNKTEITLRFSQPLVSPHIGAYVRTEQLVRKKMKIRNPTIILNRGCVCCT
jgi:hypothetical protein